MGNLSVSLLVPSVEMTFHFDKENKSKEVIHF